MNNEDIIKELKEQTKWLKFLALPKLTETIKEALKTKEQEEIYRLTDGNNSTHIICQRLKGKGINVSPMTVYRNWEKWSVLGLVVPSKRYKGRYQKITDLGDSDIKEKD